MSRNKSVTKSERTPSANDIVPIEIGSVPRGRERVIVKICSYCGKRFIDVRSHWREPGGSWKPTTKGITLQAAGAEGIGELLAIAAKRFAAMQKEQSR